MLIEINFQNKEWTFFQEFRGRNIKLLNNGKTALRTESYNQGVVIVSKPLERDVLFEVRGIFILLRTKSQHDVFNCEIVYRLL